LVSWEQLQRSTDEVRKDVDQVISALKRIPVILKHSPHG
jgi:hypothetical protein